ncbi:MAG: T9SS type A sorting domain-containing protein [Bacteroidota bacterium]|jgi:hypothetical protein
MTSEFLRKSADSLAIIHAIDAKLALVACSDMDTTGKSDIWSYLYLSADSLKEYQFHAQNNQVIFDSSHAMRVGIGVLASPWINSDSALTVAEKSGGTIIRRQFPTCTLMASLLSYVIPPFLCVWRIAYKCSDSTRTIVVNANDGIIVSVKDNTNQVTLERFELNQNYPNPFNPSTTVSFSLPSKSFVSLKVFDIMGRDVATLVSEQMSKGTYSRHWNAANMSSGIYFYRLQVGSLIETKKLILLK